MRHEETQCPLLPPIPSQLQVKGPRRADVPPSRRGLLLSLPPPYPSPLPAPSVLRPNLHHGPLLLSNTTHQLSTGQQRSLVPPKLLPPPPYYPTPPSTPCSAPSTPILVLHQGSSPSLDPGAWRHPNLGSSHFPPASPVSVLLIQGNPVSMPRLYLLLLLLLLMFLLIRLLFFEPVFKMFGLVQIIMPLHTRKPYPKPWLQHTRGSDTERSLKIFSSGKNRVYKKWGLCVFFTAFPPMSRTLFFCHS